MTLSAGTPMAAPRTSSVRVAVDGALFSGPRTGIGRYTAELIRSAARLGAHNRGAAVSFSALLFDSRARPAAVGDLEDAGVATRRPRRTVKKAFHVASRAGLPVPFAAIAPDADFFVYPNYRWYPAGRRPCLTMIYDLGYLAHPEWVHPSFLSRLARFAPKAIARSDVVGAISETMATDLRTAYPQAAQRVRVLTPGPAPMMATSAPSDWAERLQGLGLEPGYLLFVGTVEPRKNIGSLVTAMEHLGPDLAARHPLVVAGGSGWSNRATLAAIEASPWVRYLSYVPDRDLRALYAGAAVLVMPSHYEGFGLPVLDAMAAGVAVACSDIPILREVAGEAAAYFDHLRPDHIASVLAELLADPDRRAALTVAGRRRAQRFSWEQTARRFLSAIEEHA